MQTRNGMAPLTRMVEWCMAHPGASSQMVHLQGYSVQLRCSRPEWPIHGTRLAFKTIDVVSVSYDKQQYDAHCEFNAASVPKRGFDPLWDHLEKLCRSHDRALRVENVHSDHLRQSLMTRRSFELEGSMGSISIIKRLDQKGTLREEIHAYHNPNPGAGVSPADPHN